METTSISSCVETTESYQLTSEEAIEKLELFRNPPPDPVLIQSSASVATSPSLPLSPTESEQTPLYCPECYLPLHPDPKPERLYIFLHALRYTTSLGSFETEMPEWAAEGWTWDGR